MMVMNLLLSPDRTVFVSHRQFPGVEGGFRAERAGEGDAAIISEVSRTAILGDANEGKNSPENERGRSRGQGVHGAKRGTKRGNRVTRRIHEGTSERKSPEIETACGGGTEFVPIFT